MIEVLRLEGAKNGSILSHLELPRHNFFLDPLLSDHIEFSVHIKFVGAPAPHPSLYLYG